MLAAVKLRYRKLLDREAKESVLYLNHNGQIEFKPYNDRTFPKVLCDCRFAGESILILQVSVRRFDEKHKTKYYVGIGRLVSADELEPRLTLRFGKYMYAARGQQSKSDWRRLKTAFVSSERTTIERLRERFRVDPFMTEIGDETYIYRYESCCDRWEIVGVELFGDNYCRLLSATE